jgi:hypothetical protein
MNTREPVFNAAITQAPAYELVRIMFKDRQTAIGFWSGAAWFCDWKEVKPTHWQRLRAVDVDQSELSRRE